MTKILHNIFALLGFCIVILALSQCKPITYFSNPDKVNGGKNGEFSFPFDWIGQYEGTLIMHTPLDTSHVKMELSIGYPNQLGFYPWKLTYNNTDVRSYGLEVIDAKRGHYRIDEYNSIKIDAFLRDNHFISKFDVMGTDLLIDYEIIDDGIHARLYLSQVEPISVTGKAVIEQDTVPEVNSYKLSVFQEAILKKIN